MKRFRILLLAAACVICALSGCGGGAPPPAVVVTVSPATVTTDAGATQQFTATVVNANTTNVTWSVQEGANGGTITGNGLYTAPMAGGTFHVVATSAADAMRSGTATVTVRPPNPTPSLSTISPTSAQNGSVALTLTVNGTNFIANSVVRWNGANRTTTFVSSTQLTAAISASDLATAGTAAVTVFNPTPGGGVSNAVNFTINAGPVIGSLSPSTRLIGLPDFVLVVSGTGFASGSIVRWNSANLPTTYVSATELRASIGAADAAVAALVNITVFNPDTGSGAATSNLKVFTVANPAPWIASLTPDRALVGASGLTLTVTGTGFFPGSVVRWNNADRTTTFVSSTELTANIPATDLATAGSPSVTVFNPAPGGGSYASTFLVRVPNPVPVLSSISPASVTAGAGSVSITLTGTGFVSASVVRWNQTWYEFSPTSVSSTQIVFTTAAEALKYSHTVSIAVFNPEPGGGLSNSLTLPVNNPVPILTSISPPSAIAGDASTLLTLTGSGFSGNSVVQWNGSARPTLFVSGVTLTAQIPASDLASSGTTQITVFNPAPGGGTSTAVSFTIAARTSNPQPTITSLSDTQAPAGWPGFALKVTGSGFVAETVVQFDGAARPTSVISSTEARAAIPPSDLAQARAVQVAVVNPSPGGGTSNNIGFSIVPVVADAPGVVDLASKNAEFVPGDKPSNGFAMSADARYIAFASMAENLVPTAILNQSSVFLRDTCRGAVPGCVPNVIRISQDELGQQANGGSDSPAISADGRYVAFVSAASNLVNDGVLGENVFVRDTCNGAPAGCVAGIVRVTSFSADEGVYNVSISGNGRYVAYQVNNSSGASSYVADTCAGASAGCVASEIVRFDDVGEPRLSVSGRYLLFSSLRADLVTNDTNDATDIFVHDLCIGAPAGCTPATQIVSQGASDVPANGYSFAPALSGDGRFVVFSSWATNLAADATDPNVWHQVYWRDTCLGAAAGCTPATVRISVSDAGTQVVSGGPATGGSIVSQDGRYVVFGSNKPGLVSGVSGFTVYLRDTCWGVPTGCTPSTRVLSQSLTGSAGNSSSWSGALTPDGKFAGFRSSATNLGPGSASEVEVYVARTGRP